MKLSLSQVGASSLFVGLLVAQHLQDNVDELNHHESASAKVGSLSEVSSCDASADAGAAEGFDYGCLKSAALEMEKLGLNPRSQGHGESVRRIRASVFETMADVLTPSTNPDGSWLLDHVARCKDLATNSTLWKETCIEAFSRGNLLLDAWTTLPDASSIGEGIDWLAGAARAGNSQLFRFLLQNRSQELTRSEALACLAGICYGNAVPVLQSFGVYMTKYHELKRDAVVQSAEMGSLEIFQYLLTEMESVRTLFGRRPELKRIVPLAHQVACMHGQTEILQYIDDKYPSYRDLATSILSAIASGNGAIVRRYLWDSQANGPRKMPRLRGTSLAAQALWMAARHDRVEIVKLLLQRAYGALFWPLQNEAADVNHALALAAENRAQASFERVLSEFPEIKITNTVLEAAIKGGDQVIVQRLIKGHVEGFSQFYELNLAFDDNTPLRVACRYGNMPVLVDLVEGKKKNIWAYQLIDPAAKDNEAIIEAFQYGKRDTYEYLMSLKEIFPKIEPGAQSCEAFVRAARLKDPSHLEYLLSNTVVPAEALSRALAEALHFGSEETVDFLMSHQAPVTLEVVSMAAQFASPQLPRLLELLLERGIKLEDPERLNKMLASRHFFQRGAGSPRRGRSIANNPILLAAVKSRDMQTIKTIFKAIYDDCPDEEILQEISDFLVASGETDVMKMVQTLSKYEQLQGWESKALATANKERLIKWGLRGSKGALCVATLLVASTVGFDFLSATYYSLEKALLEAAASVKDPVIASMTNQLDFLSGGVMQGFEQYVSVPINGFYSNVPPLAEMPQAIHRWTWEPLTNYALGHLNGMYNGAAAHATPYIHQLQQLATTIHDEAIAWGMPIIEGVQLKWMVASQAWKTATYGDLLLFSWQLFTSSCANIVEGVMLRAE